MYIVGLTGGIGSGKSTAADFFRRHVDVVDADEVARWVVHPESSALRAIASHFGTQAITTDGALNRPWVREKIFSELNEKIWLENLLHPLIRTEIVSALNNCHSTYCILMSPLLLETDQYMLSDRILVVDIPEDMQITRATKRDNSSDDTIKAIIKTQSTRHYRLGKADDVILNTGDMTMLEKSITNLHNQYVSFATK